MIQLMILAAVTVAVLAGAALAHEGRRAALVRERVADGVARAAAEAELRDLLRRRAWRTRGRGLLKLAGGLGLIAGIFLGLAWGAAHDAPMTRGLLVLLLFGPYVGWALAMIGLFELATARPTRLERWADLAARGPDPAATERLMTGTGPPARTCSVCGTPVRWPRRGLCADCAARAG